MFETRNGKEVQWISTDFFRIRPGTGETAAASLNALNSAKLVRLTVKLNDHPMKAMLDSGSTSNFLSADAAWTAGLTMEKKKEPYLLHVGNGELLPGQGKITHECRNLPLDIGGHQEKITLDIIDTANHDIILGLPWLRKHNPNIDWTTQQLSMRRCKCKYNARPTREANPPVEEKRIGYMASMTASKKTKVSSSDTRNEPTDHHEREQGIATLSIPKEYKRWERLFKDVVDIRALPKHQP